MSSGSDLCMAHVQQFGPLHGPCPVVRTSAWPMSSSSNLCMAHVQQFGPLHGPCPAVRTSAWPMSSRLDLCMAYVQQFGPLYGLCPGCNRQETGNRFIYNFQVHFRRAFELLLRSECPMGYCSLTRVHVLTGPVSLWCVYRLVFPSSLLVLVLAVILVVPSLSVCLSVPLSSSSLSLCLSVCLSVCLCL